MIILRNEFLTARLAASDRRLVRSSSGGRGARLPGRSPLRCLDLLCALPHEL